MKRLLLICSLLVCAALASAQRDLPPPAPVAPANQAAPALKPFLGPAPETLNAVEEAKEIKSSRLYRDPGITASSNWLSNALDRLNNLLRRLIRQPQATNFNPSLPEWVVYVMWGVLAIGASVFAYFALRYARWRAGLQRQALGVLEEDEPERSLDEWLEMADRLNASGDYRGAVRCLYLACLLKFDEARVARFDRGQTNWEHLARIEVSPRLPSGLDFRSATKAFDRVWYGKIVRGEEDVDFFRSVYLEIKGRTEQAVAA